MVWRGCANARRCKRTPELAGAPSCRTATLQRGPTAARARRAAIVPLRCWDGATGAADAIGANARRCWPAVAAACGAPFWRA